MLPFMLYPVFSTIMFKEFARMIHTPLFLDASDPIAPFYRVKNAITGEEVEDVVFADTRCGMYETLERDGNGKVVIYQGSPVYRMHYAPIYFERIGAETPAIASSNNSLWPAIPARMQGDKVDIVMYSRRQGKKATMSNHLANHRRERFKVIQGGRA